MPPEREVVLGRSRLRQRPIQLGMPLVLSDYEDVHGRIFLDAVIHPLQEMVEPAKDIAIRIKRGVRAVVDSADDPLVNGVGLRADD